MAFENEILARLSSVYSQHENGTVFVTEKVSYMMKEVTKRARKNYLGVYDEPYDPVTGEEKYFPPLTETFCDGVIKSIDIDLNDIDIFSTNGANVGAAKILSTLVKQKLKEANFSETLNELIRHLVIDGHGTLKFMDEYDPRKKKRKMAITVVDNLNLVADQSADGINESFGSIERALLTQEELMVKKNVWMNVDEVIKNGTINSFQRYSWTGNIVESPAPYYAVYDYWGQVEKKWVTCKEEDAGIWIEGHVVLSNLHSEGEKKVLLVEENKGGIRPYEDVALKRVIGRRQGRGVPEQLFGTQKYMNMLIEIRKKNAQILQNGLFKAKRGLGLTADSIISKLTTGGIITVNDQDDFTQMPIDDTRASSYQDEDRLLAWGERNTGMFDVRRGEALAASAPATTQLIQDRNSKDLFQLVQENLGLMLERFIENHVIPWIIDNVKDEEVVMITGDLKDLEEFDNAMAEYLVNKELIKFVEKNRQYPRPEELVDAKRKQKETLKRLGKRRYIELKKSMFAGAEVGVQVVVGNEAIDRATILQKLQEILTLTVTAPGVLNIDAQGVIDTIFKMMNIPTDRIYLSREIYQTPIDKLSTAMQKQATALPAQGMNKLTGSLAPQQNATLETEQNIPARSPGIRQTATNLTAL